MAKPDFSKIFAQNGAIAALTDAQFLQGFEYLGDNPPTKEEFNWLFQRLFLQTQWLESQNAAFTWQPNKSYVVGDICYSPNAPSYTRMECTVAGTSGTTEPTWPAVGQTVVDGTVTWIVRDLRIADAQFDNSKKLATTAFVKQALGNRRGFTSYSTNTSLTANDLGKYIYVTANITLTLPDATTIPAGASIYIQASSMSVVTVTSPNGIIDGPNGTSGSNTLVIQAGNATEFINSGTYWLAVGGSGFANLTTNGFQKLPSGLILQWGETSLIAPDTEIDVVFPIAFPNSCLSIVGSPLSNNVRTNTGAVFENVSKTGFRVANDLFVTGNGNNATIKWIAFGY